MSLYLVVILQYFIIHACEVRKMSTLLIHTSTIAISFLTLFFILHFFYPFPFYVPFLHLYVKFPLEKSAESLVAWIMRVRSLREISCLSFCSRGISDDSGQCGRRECRERKKKRKINALAVRAPRHSI